MSNNFSRTLRALRSDGLAGWTVRALVAALLLVLWGGWFFWGGVTVWAVSERARAEVRDQVFTVDAPVDGQVVAVHIERGQKVTQGDVLVELETFEQEGERDSLVAELTGLRSRREDLIGRIDQEGRALAIWLEASRAMVEEARLNVERAESAAALARSNEARVRKLHEESLLPDEELDRAVSELEQSEAEVQSLRAAAQRTERERASASADRGTEIEQLKADLRVLESQITAIGARIGSLEQQVGLRQIRAPASGTLARVANLRPGAVVDAGDELARIVPSGRIGAVAWYQPAEAVGRIRAGQHARLRLDGFPSTQFGTIPATVSVVDSETTDGRIRVDLDIDADRPTNIQLQHGMVGNVEVEVDRLSPASLLMRAVGKLLDQPAQARAES